MPTFAPMQQRKKAYGLLALWLVMAIAVVLVWQLHEHKKVASVYVFPVDGELMQEDWAGFQTLMDSLQPFGILIEPDTLGQKPEFGRLAGVSLSDRMKQRYPNQFFSITPDSLYQKAFATSIRKSVDKLNELDYQKLVAWEKNVPQLRSTALLEDSEIRDSILTRIHLGRVEILGPQFERIPKRYAGLLMGTINKRLLQYPDKSWFVIVDIEKYTWLKTKLVEDQRIAVLNETGN